MSIAIRAEIRASIVYVVVAWLTNPDTIGPMLGWWFLCEEVGIPLERIVSSSRL